MFATSSETPSWKSVNSGVLFFPLLYRFPFFPSFSQFLSLFIPVLSHFSLASFKIFLLMTFSENWIKPPCTTPAGFIALWPATSPACSVHFLLYLHSLYETGLALLNAVTRVLVNNQSQYVDVLELFIHASATFQSLQYLVHTNAIIKEAEKPCWWSLPNCWQKKT